MKIFQIISIYDKGDDDLASLFDPVEEAMPEADDFDPETYDKYIASEVLLPKGDQ